MSATSVLQRVLARLRRSMAVQISAAIALISILVVATCAWLLDGMLTREMRRENELLLLANLAFIRDDLASADFDVARAAPQLVDRTERRVHRLHVEILDEQRHVIATSSLFPVPVNELPQQVLSANELPTELSMMQVEGLRERLGALTTMWVGSDEHRYRVLLGRIALPPRAEAPAGAVLVALAVRPTAAIELRAQDRRNALIALSVAALLAVVFGSWIARRIVNDAKRLGAAASRIGAQAMHERLPLEGTPSELLESTVAFNHMLDRLEVSFERLSAFSSDLAHDLRTPIGNLLGEAQVALSRPRSAAEYRGVLESAVEEYERLSRMIGNMLFLARADNAQAVIAAEWLEVREALERVIAYFEQVAEDRGVALVATVRAAPDALERVWADETMLIRALSNLVSNALRYAPRGTVVELAAIVDGTGRCVIEVSNEGPAIAEELQGRIFERFVRGEVGREGSAAGSGLGLAIVRSIMELHRGRAEVSSEPGRRTAFRLAFDGP